MPLLTNPDARDSHLTYYGSMDGWDDNSNQLAVVLACLAVIGLIYLMRSFWRRLRRAFKPRPRRKRPYWRLKTVAATRLRPPPSAPFALRRFWVVDGDTIQDNATRTVYRLENIDCPETDDRAKCFRERKQGERAKFEAVRLLKGAKTITVRPTGKVDQYGRSIATIYVDGQDFGELMIARGFARPWRGVREDWCGPNGGLARLAEACSAKLHCNTCGARAGVVTPGTVMNFPAAYRKPPEAPGGIEDGPTDTKPAEASE